MNFIGAIVIFSAMLFVWGKETLPMQNVTQGYDYTETALKNGFRNGDIIVGIDGKPVTQLSDALEQILLDDTKQVNVIRDGKKHNIDIPKDFAKQMLASQTTQFATPRFPFVIDNFAIGSAAGYKSMTIFVADLSYICHTPVIKTPECLHMCNFCCTFAADFILRNCAREYRGLKNTIRGASGTGSSSESIGS